MALIIRDLLSSDIGPAVRLLEECRSLPDTKPADIAQFVNDVSSSAPGVVAVDGERIIGVIQARIVSDDGWINVVTIDPAWRHQGVGSKMLLRLEEKLMHLGVRKISALLSKSQAGETALVNRHFLDDHRQEIFLKSAL